MDQLPQTPEDTKRDRELNMLARKAKMSFGIAAITAGLSLSVVSNMDKGDLFDPTGKLDAMVATAVQNDPKLNPTKYREETKAALEGQANNVRVYCAIVCLLMGFRMNKHDRAYKQALENKPR